MKLKIIFNINELDFSETGHDLTIGNFDGVHIGHQSLLRNIRKNSDAKLILITFRPHPQTILRSVDDRFLINSYDDRRELLSSCNVDYLLELKFDRDFSMQEPSSFLKNYVQSIPGLKNFYLGYDFVFGKDKKGDFQFSKSFLKNVNVKRLDEYIVEDSEHISSTEVRELLRKGDIEKSHVLLGRHFYLDGNIVKGDGRGKTIGFPTANITIDKDRLIPKSGVYITRSMINSMVYHSVTNIGYKPTFNEKKILSVETHLLDFDEEIYGENLKVYFLKRLRGEEKFSSVNELIVQIKEDVKKTEAFFET